MKTSKISFGTIIVLLSIIFVQFAHPSTAYAAGKVGTGTPESCTEAALDTALSGGGIVNFDCGPDPVTITVTSAKEISIDTQIDGGGKITISGGNAVRLFLVDASATLDISGLTLSDGSLSGGTGGGAIYSYSGATVKITDSTFSNNSSGDGSAGGGAIYNEGALSIKRSTFSQNRAAGDATDGGAILSSGASSRVDIENSTFYGNIAGDSSNSYLNSVGGAINIRESNGPNTITDVTISNSANDASYGALDIVNANADLSLSVLANSTSGFDCSNRSTDPFVFTSTNNLIETDSSTDPCTAAVTGDPSLDPLGLQDNGGPTQTLALSPDSIAIDALADSLLTCGAATDQRGVVRPLDGNGNDIASCDLGAYEYENPGLEPTTTTITMDDPDPSVVGQAVTVMVTVSGDTTTPTGTVSITGADTNCTITLSSGTGSCDANFASAGVKTLTATYNGDSTHAASSDVESHTVNKASTTTTIDSDAPDPSVVGQAVTVEFAVAVTAPGSGTPTGDVTVTDSASAAFCTASVATGSCDITLNTLGARTLTATYEGDANFLDSASTGTAHTVDQAPMITSADTTTFTIGEAGTFTITTTGIPTPTVAHTAGSLPSGVIFTDNGNGTASLSGTPQAGTQGDYNLVFTASNGVGTDAIQNFTLTISTPGAGTYDDMNTNWIYTGTWASGSSFSGAQDGTLHYTGTVGDTASFVFNGTQFVLSYTQDTNRGDIGVYVDGSLVTTIDASGSFQWQQTYTSQDYGPGTHLVTFKHAGGGAYIDIDAVEIKN